MSLWGGDLLGLYRKKETAVAGQTAIGGEEVVKKTGDFTRFEVGRFCGRPEGAEG